MIIAGGYTGKPFLGARFLVHRCIAATVNNGFLGNKAGHPAGNAGRDTRIRIQPIGEETIFPTVDPVGPVAVADPQYPVEHILAPKKIDETIQQVIRAQRMCLMLNGIVHTHFQLLCRRVK